MDAGLLGALVAVVVAVVAVVLFRPKKTAPLSELLDALDRIEADPDSTAVQKGSVCQALYNGYRKHTVSVVGRIADVFPNGSVVMETSLRQVPAVGFDFNRIKEAQLHSLTKGRSITLRASLDTWEKFKAAPGIVEVLGKGRVFCDGRWYGVKNLYRAGTHRADSEIKQKEAV